MGMDLGGPVGTEVHSFADGVVHSVGYNSELGDYGHVVVVEYDLGSSLLGSNIDRDGDGNGDATCASEKEIPKVWALYGHLDASTLERNQVGKEVKRGDILGLLGDVHENGGWSIPHVHFQLSIQAPLTHDMPGAVALNDRARALVNYPDPRFIMGELY